MNRIDILNEFKRIINNVNYESVITITKEDLKEIEDYEIVGTISSYLVDSNDDLSFSVINDNKLTNCLINFIVAKEFKLSAKHNIIKEIECMFPDIDLRIGTYLDDNMNHLCCRLAFYMKLIINNIIKINEESPSNNLLKI